MGKYKTTSVNPAEIALENIFRVMETRNFSKDDSAAIVGGPGRLKELIAKQKIRAEKGKNVQNSKWKCNAADVLRHCRNMRPKNKETT